MTALAWPRSGKTAQPRDLGIRGATGIAAAILILIIIQRWLAGHDIYSTLPAFAAYPPVPIFRSLPRETGEPFRIVGRAHALVPGTSALYELEDARGYEALTFSRYVATYDAWCKHQPVWFNRVDDLTKPFLSMLNVRYAIASDNSRRPMAGAAWPCSAVPNCWRTCAFFPARSSPIASCSAPRSTAHQRDEGRDRFSRARLDRSAAARRRARKRRMHRGQRARDGGDLLVEAATSAGGWVVITEPAWDGWRIYIDGRRVSISTQRGLPRRLRSVRRPHDPPDVPAEEFRAAAGRSRSPRWRSSSAAACSPDCAGVAS